MYKTVPFTNPHRKKHFDFFKKMDQPHFNICANVEVTNLLGFIATHKYPFTPVMVYFITRVANEVSEFKQRIRAEEIIEHDVVHPSFTVNTEIADVFSFCTVIYDRSFPKFLKEALEVMDEMRTNPSFEDEEGRDDLLFLSAIPWVSFSSFAHAMHYSPADSIPRITWGKYFKKRKKAYMPLSVQAHHAVVDGRHTGRYFELFQQYMKDPAQVLG